VDSEVTIVGLATPPVTVTVTIVEFVIRPPVPPAPVIVTEYTLAAVEVKVQSLAAVNVPPAFAAGTVILAHEAVRPEGDTEVVKLITPDDPVAPKPAVALPTGRL